MSPRTARFRRCLPLAPWLVAAVVAGSCKARDGKPGSAPALDASAAPSAPPEEPTGRLHYRVLDAASGAPIPCKLTFVRQDGGARPFGDGDVPLVQGNAVAGAGRVYSLSGEGALDVPLGRYEVMVTRGPEWTLAKEAVTVGKEPAQLGASLAHVVDTAGWLSGDFHVHSEPSWDSSVPLAARVREFAAEGVELLVATDHNLVTDFAPVIAALSAGELLASIPGSELTTHAWGHFGAFPLPESARSWPVMTGTMIQEGTAETLIHRTRQKAPGVLVTANHPRLGGLGYFNLGGFDRTQGKLTRDGASQDYDAIEVLNGFENQREADIDGLMADWLSLFETGRRVAGLGNSDTHHLANNLAGYPRNYLAMADDRPAAVRAEGITGAVRAGRVLFTTGPFVRLTVEGAGLGETALVGPKARGHLRVDAAPWLEVTRVMLYVGSQVVQRWTVPESAAVRRFEVDFEVDGTKPTFVLARAEGERALSPLAGEAGQYDVRPIAITNPVFLRPRGGK